MVTLIVVLVVALIMTAESVGYSFSSGSVAVIYINGTITAGESQIGLFGGDVTGSDTITSYLQDAALDGEIRAVVLRMNSPGGAAAAQVISAEVRKVSEAGKAVVTSMGDVAASGAYWIAAHSDEIVANPATMTGSIGVIIETVHTQELYEKLGIDTQTIKSGPYKDMGSQNRPLTPEEREILQGMVDDIYEQFIEAVVQGRDMSPEAVRRLADGRVFTGRHGGYPGELPRSPGPGGPVGRPRQRLPGGGIRSAEPVGPPTWPEG